LQKNCSAFVRAVLAIALALALTSCVTPPNPPAPPISWPVLPLPPETGISLAGGVVSVPWDYWASLAQYVAEVGLVRNILEREGRLTR
jgi:hypothetical protein